MTTLTPENLPLTIDRDNLDKALQEHPELVRQVGLASAAAMSAKDGFAKKAKELMAREEEAVRRRLERRGKVTENAVKSALERSDTAAAIRKQEADLAAAVRRWDVAVDAVRARGYALHKLVDLQVIYGGAVAGTSERADRARSARREAGDAVVQEAVRRRRGVAKE